MLLIVGYEVFDFLSGGKGGARPRKVDISVRARNLNCLSGYVERTYFLLRW
jgi:hypothetical protein